MLYNFKTTLTIDLIKQHWLVSPIYAWIRKLTEEWNIYDFTDYTHKAFYVHFRGTQYIHWNRIARPGAIRKVLLLNQYENTISYYKVYTLRLTLEIDITIRGWGRVEEYLWAPQMFYRIQKLRKPFFLINFLFLTKQGNKTLSLFRSNN